MEDCKSCSYTILQLGDIARDPNLLIGFLIRHNCLKALYSCPKCSSEKRLNEENLTFQCNNKLKVKEGKSVGCSFTLLATDGTLFHDTQLVMREIFMLLFYWLMLPRFGDNFIIEQLEILPKTISCWSAYFREICFHWCINSSEKIGGDGKTIEFDEGFLKFHKPHKSKKIKGTWLFTGFEKGTNKFFFVPVKEKNSKYLLEVIQNWVNPGSEIIADFWEKYECIDDEEFANEVIEKKKSFVNEEKGLLYSPDNIWMEVMGSIPRFHRGSPISAFMLSEYIFKRYYHNINSRLHPFLLMAAKLLPPR